ncbi:hypothetical protein ACH5RR_030963 [Cinchona calisaya]|uniref:protein-serine/threonine phosphatase n=1 Tax=Cinchona calisaya TaxID=153742 RepID=A0ABD2YDT8_9GENT
MVAEAAAAAEMLFQQSVSVRYHLCLPTNTTPSSSLYIVDTPSPPPSSPPVLLSKSPTTTTTTNFEISRSESALSCSTSIQTTTTFVDTPRNTKFLPAICSGSHTDTGPRRSNEDEHICIDDLSKCLGSLCGWPLPSSFYAVFDGHGGSDAAAYVKNNAMKFFFEDVALPQKSDIDELFLEELESCHRRAFLEADQALAVESSVGACCGTTAITALVLGRHLLIANAGDCRAVLCRKGVAVQLSQDHRPSSAVERKRVEDLGGVIEYGYLNGELSVTRALGDWYMKLPVGSVSPLTAEPEVQHILLSEDDEFLIIGCDGIWDVMSNQDAVSLVRRELRHHGDPQQCARELVDHALHKDTSDNLTVIVVCFTSLDRRDSLPSQRPRLRCCSLSEEARRKLRSLLEGN